MSRYGSLININPSGRIQLSLSSLITSTFGALSNLVMCDLRKRVETKNSILMNSSLQLEFLFVVVARNSDFLICQM